MPARTVPKNYRHVTGRVYNSRTRSSSAFESTLERDYLLLLDFDPAVARYEEQPVTLDYSDRNGVQRRYTPDVLVEYADGSFVLCEVKRRDDLSQHWAEYKAKFKAARRYARERGGRFRLISEREIRTPYLGNVKFLRPYRGYVVDPVQQAELLGTLAQGPVMTVECLLAVLAPDRDGQAHWLPVLWHLVAQRRVGADLEQPLTRDSRVWLNARETP